MSYHAIHVDDDTWDDFISKQPNAHILQTSSWAHLKSNHGWHQERITLADETGFPVAGAQILFRNFVLLPFTVAYLGKGPYGDLKAIEELWPKIHTCARKNKAIFLKWEPDINSTKQTYSVRDFQNSSETIQPPRTIIVDIDSDPEEILARMNQGTRRKIRKSLRDLTFRQGHVSDIPSFYSLLKHTAERNHFGIHPQSYYEQAANSFLPNQASLIFAERDDQTLAAVMVFSIGKRAWYFYGGSCPSARKHNAGYGAQWAAILWAHEKGCIEYDLWGIPDEEIDSLETQFKKRTDGLWGVYGFKRGWGGEITRSPGALDYVYQPFVYQALRKAFSLRRKFYT